MIRVLHIGLSSHLGGIESYLYKLANNINKKKYKFDFMVIGDEQKACYYDDLKRIGCGFYSVTSRKDSYIKHKKDIKELFKNNNFDIIHCHMNSLSNIAPIKLALKFNRKVIVHSRNGQLSSSHFFITKFLHYYNCLRLPKKDVKKLAVSKVAGEWMFGKNADFSVLNNGIDVNKFKFNEVARRKIRQQLDIKDEFCIVHVGAFRSQKNHDFILDIFKHFVEIKPKSKLLLLGTGELMSQFKYKANELGIINNILMVGNKNNVSDYLSAGDVFLFPSLFEGFPNAVLEAQASGLPCLISDTITKEVLINNNCVTFPLEKSPIEWAQKILELPAFDNRLKAAENITQCGLSVKQEVKKIETIYKEFVN